MPQRLIRYILFGVAFFGMLACSATYFYSFGLSRLCEAEDGSLLAFEGVVVEDWNDGSHISYTAIQAIYRSEDGGITWTLLYNQNDLFEIRGQMGNLFPLEVELPDCIPDKNSRFDDPWLMRLDQTIFQIIPNKGVYKIDSEGMLVREFDLSFYQREARPFIPFDDCDRAENKYSTWTTRWTIRDFPDTPEGNSSGYTDYGGPSDAVVHTGTGNFVLLGRRDGALIRTPDGVWQWATIGDCSYIATEDPRVILQILLIELLLMLPIVPIYALVRAKRIGWFKRTLLGLIMVAWVTAVLLTRSDFLLDGLMTVSDSPVTIFMVIVFSVILLVSYLSVIPTLLHFLWVSYDKSLRVFRRLGMLLGLFIMPYLLWVLGIIPYHFLASVIALILTAWGLRRVYMQSHKLVNQGEDVEI